MLLKSVLWPLNALFCLVTVAFYCTKLHHLLYSQKEIHGSRMTKKSKHPLHMAKLLLLLPLILYLAFLIPEEHGYWDQLLGLDAARSVADRFDRSVGPDDAIPVRKGEKEFDPVIGLIERYSRNKLNPDKAPMVIARFQAKVYDAQPLWEGERLAQWTSPATPIAVMYFDWPNVKYKDGNVPKDEATVVGTLGDLHEWISRRHMEIHFYIVDLLLVGILPLLLGLYLYFVERFYEKK